MKVRDFFKYMYKPIDCKQRTSNICLLTYLCIYSERERERERERESNTFEVGRQNDNVFLNMIFQLKNSTNNSSTLLLLQFSL